MNKHRFLIAALVVATVIGGPLAGTHKASAASNIIPGLSQPQLSITDPSVNKTYVAGTGEIAVIDNTTDKLLTYIPAPHVDANNWVQFFVNPTLHRVYAIWGGTLVAIDTTTDTVVATAAYNFAGVPVYDPTTDTLYGQVATPFGVTPEVITLDAIDGATLSVLRSTPTLFTEVSWQPLGGYLTLDSANHRIYITAGGEGIPTTVFKELDTQTFAILAQSQCNPNFLCWYKNLNMYGALMAAPVVNPRDGSLWFSMDITSPGTTSCGDNGGCGTFGGSPVATRFWRYDPVTQTLTGVDVLGRAIGQAFDPQTGLLYVAASDLPTVNASLGTASPSVSTTGSTLPQIGTVDLSVAQPIVTQLTIQGLSQIPGTSFNCNNGPFGLRPLGFDFNLRNVYWGCDGYDPSTGITAFSKIATTKMDNVTQIAPGVLFPPTVYGVLVSEVDTPIYDRIATAVNKPRNQFYSSFGSSVLPTDASGQIVEYGFTDNLAIMFNPTTLSTAAVPFTPEAFIPQPFTLPVSGNVSNSRALAGTVPGIQGIPVTITDGASFTQTTVTDLLGDYSFPAVPPGTYTVSVDPGSAWVAPNGPSQSISLTFNKLTGLNFSLMPPVTMKMSWNLPTGTVLNFGPGISFTGAVTLNEVAPAGGITVNLTTDNPKALGVPATVTVPAGFLSNNFTVKTNGVTAASPARVFGSYSGTYNPAETLGELPAVTVYPADSIQVVSATWSQSTGLLSVIATDNDPVAAITISDPKNNTFSATLMATDGNGHYSFSTMIPVNPPSSVQLVSNLGNKTGPGIKKVN